MFYHACVCAFVCVMLAVTAGQVFLRVCWFSFGLESLINEEREREGEKRRERESLINDWRVMD